MLDPNEVPTVPSPHWFVDENKTFQPYTDIESSELERVYQFTNGRSAYYIGDADRLVDFLRKEERSKKKGTRKVVRGTWFFEDNDGKLYPYLEEIARELEQKYQNKDHTRLKVSDHPVRFVEHKNDGTWRQYRYTKNGDILGRKVIRGYKGLVLDASTDTVQRLPTPTPLSVTQTINDFFRKADSTKTITSPPSLLSSTTTTQQANRNDTSLRVPSRPIIPPPPVSLQRTLYPAGHVPTLQRSPVTAGKTISRQQTIVAKERLLEFGRQITDKGRSPQELKAEIDYREIVKNLQEENAKLLAINTELERKIIELENKILPSTIAQIENLDTQNNNLASLVIDKEEELDEKNELIQKLMEKIRRITGKDEVYLGDDNEDYVNGTMRALTNIVQAYDKNEESRSQLTDTLSDILRDINLDDLDEFDELLKKN